MGTSRPHPNPPESTRTRRSPPVRGSWLELTHHPPPANLAAPEDGRTPDFVGGLERRVRRRNRTTGRRTTHPIRAARWNAGGDGAARRPYLQPGWFRGGGRMWGRATPAIFHYLTRCDRQRQNATFPNGGKGFIRFRAAKPTRADEMGYQPGPPSHRETRTSACAAGSHWAPRSRTMSPYQTPPNCDSGKAPWILVTP